MSIAQTLTTSFKQQLLQGPIEVAVRPTGFYHQQMNSINCVVTHGTWK